MLSCFSTFHACQLICYFVWSFIHTNRLPNHFPQDKSSLIVRKYRGFCKWVPVLSVRKYLKHLFKAVAGIKYPFIRFCINIISRVLINRKIKRTQIFHCLKGTCTFNVLYHCFFVSKDVWFNISLQAKLYNMSYYIELTWPLLSKQNNCRQLRANKLNIKLIVTDLCDILLAYNKYLFTVYTLFQ